MRPNPVLWGSLVDEWGTRLQVKEAEKVVGALRRDQVSLRDEEARSVTLSRLIFSCQVLDHFLLCWSFSAWSTT